MTQKYTCTKCGEIVEYPDGEDLFEVALSHGATCQARQTPPVKRRLADVVPESAIKGNLVTIDDILGKEVLVVDLTWRDSSFKEDQEYLSLTIQVDGEEKTLNTGATQVLGAFKALDTANLPVYAVFEKVTRPDGKRVYRVS